MQNCTHGRVKLHVHVHVCTIYKENVLLMECHQHTATTVLKLAVVVFSLGEPIETKNEMRSIMIRYIFYMLIYNAGATHTHMYMYM